MFTLQLLGSASLDGPDGPVTGRAALRQRVALLALLAVEHPRPLSRDKLLAYLWPESRTADARHLLRESLYILRSALGDDSVLGTGDGLRLNPERMSCDVWEFGAALARGDLESAVRVYRGPFLSGFHLSEADELEHWAERERLRLARQYCQALEHLAERQMRDGNARGAVEWWSRLAGEDPYSSRIALRYMQALEAAGDRAGALRHASEHTDLLRTELDAAPEQEVLELAERLRLQSRAAPGPAATMSPPTSADLAFVADDSAGSPVAPLPTVPTRSTRRRWLPAAVALMAVVVGLGLVGGVLSRERPPALSAQRVAAAIFENRTGRPDLDDFGSMAADWIIRGVMEAPLVDIDELEAVYARRSYGSARPAGLPPDGQDSAGLVIRGSYYLSGDSVLFQAGVMEAATGRIIRSFDPIGSPIDRPTAALEALRERIAVGLSGVVNPLYGGNPVDPDQDPPPNLPAYREFVAGLKADGEAAAEHYRRAARLDSTFVPPLIQLASNAIGEDECSTTDSIGAVLDRRRDQVTAWNRITIDLLRARCRDDRAKEVHLFRQRYETYPRSLLAKGTYAALLHHSNQPRAARDILLTFAPLQGYEAWYWGMTADCWHVLDGYQTELEITERWRDSTSRDWQVMRGRALAALGREGEVKRLLRHTPGASEHLAIATELAAHGYAQMAMTVAEGALARLEIGAIADSGLRNIAWANRLLGRAKPEQEALERILESDADPLTKQEVEARLAVLQADTARAQRIDGVLAEQSARPLMRPWVRGSQILTRAHIAAGFGRRQQAVALLREAAARGTLFGGASLVFHHDPLLAPLRGYPPFDALIEPAN
jgi:DNA-binding SARP family transcriptional activator